METMEELVDHIAPILRIMRADPIGRIAPVPRLEATRRSTRESAR
jgi:hypothetical protein